MKIDLDALRLAKGSHEDGPGIDDPNCEACLFEAYNALVGVTAANRSGLTDDCPPDVSPILHGFGMRLNDALPDDRRQALKEFLPRDGQPSPLAGTAGDGLDEARGFLALDWLVRTYTPAWLDLAGLTVEARQLRDLRRIVDVVAAQAAGPVVRDAQTKAAAAWAVARDAAWAVARAAAWAAAGDAARAAAGDAAWDAARDAAWAAARAAAGAAAGAAARDAAGAAAGAAARAAAGAAARAAAWDVLQPTVDQLQTSAIDLYRAMVRPQEQP